MLSPRVVVLIPMAMFLDVHRTFPGLPTAPLTFQPQCGLQFKRYIVSLSLFYKPILLIPLGVCPG